MWLAHHGQIDTTQGPIWRQILAFFFPILIGTFFQQLYNTVDAVIVGHYVGKEALASVSGSSGQIIGLVVGFFTGLSAGSSVLISQYFGAKDEKRLHLALHTAYAFSLAGGLLAGFLGIALTNPLLDLLSTPENLMRDSSLYMTVYFSGLLFIFVYNMGSSALRAIGDSTRPLVYLVVCCLINIVLDLLLVRLFGLGVLGVAIATLAAQAVSALLVTRALLRGADGLKLSLKEIRLKKEMLIPMLKIGLPTGLQSSLYSISNMTVQSSINAFGVDTMAAWGAHGKLESFFWMIDSALGISVTTFAGQNFGAGKLDRVKRGTVICLLMDIGAAFACFLLFYAKADLLYGIFSREAEVIAIDKRMLMVISPWLFLYAFIEIFSGSLRAQGYAFMTTMFTLTGICLLRVVWVKLIVPAGTLEQVIFCYPLTWVVTSAAMIVYYVYKQRKICRMWERKQ